MNTTTHSTLPGFGQWTRILDEKDPEDLELIVELLTRLYNRPAEGFFIKEIFASGKMVSRSLLLSLGIPNSCCRYRQSETQ